MIVFLLGSVPTIWVLELELLERRLTTMKHVNGEIVDDVQKVRSWARFSLNFSTLYAKRLTLIVLFLPKLINNDHLRTTHSE